ncbi:MAG TPA: PAS domain S-box protein, partial [Alphaproteobacteria bacterium]|nr:PAS domain S-box protein [Alphaproteobacteria bacterium]
MGPHGGGPRGERHGRTGHVMKRRLDRETLELIDPRRMLSAVVDAAPVSLCVIDSGGRVLMAEGDGFADLGLDPGTAVGRTVGELWAEIETLRKAAALAVAGEPATATAVVGERALEARFLPVAGSGNTLSHVVVVITDVTARYAGMVQIPAREEFLQGILDTVVDGIVTIDELGLIRDFNPAAARIFGYQPAEVIGKTITMLMPEPHRSAHDGHIKRYLATGRSSVVGARREIVGLRKDGTVFPMELSVSELRVEEHRHFTGVVRDITDRKEAERALRESEERYALAARGANDGLWDWNLVDDTIYYSQRWKAMLG